MSLLDKLMKAGSIPSASVLADSPFFNEKDVITTDLPILNVAFTGLIDGGMIPGLSVFAGAPKTFKTLLSLFCMKAYLSKYPDGVAVLYDSEFGITPEYLVQQGIDTERVIHIPIKHVEELKFDFVKRLNSVVRGDKVFFMVDSLGALASKKEVEDADDEKSVVDMTRAKAIRSLLRIITPHLTMKDIPCIIINHIYQTQEMYSKVVIPGGTAVTYNSNQVFVISRAQEKDKEGDLSGYKFTITIEKSRTIREKTKLPFDVSFENGINKFSGMLDLALESGDVVKPKMGWYSLVDRKTGEINEKKVREDATKREDFLGVVMKREEFRKYIADQYILKSPTMVTDNEVEEELDDA